MPRQKRPSGKQPRRQGARSPQEGEVQPSPVSPVPEALPAEATLPVGPQIPATAVALPPKPVLSTFAEHGAITEGTDEARLFYSQGSYGEIVDKGKVHLSYLEALYLQERGKLAIRDARGREMGFEQVLGKARRSEPNLWVRYRVFRDMRSRGYIVKTALKFGADFRVYDRGVKPGEDHARWVVYPVHEGSVLTWHEFAAKNRVAHSTKKRLMLGIVDDEGDVTYYEVRWMRP